MVGRPFPPPPLEDGGRMNSHLWLCEKARLSLSSPGMQLLPGREGPSKRVAPRARRGAARQGQSSLPWLDI